MQKYHLLDHQILLTTLQDKEVIDHFLNHLEEKKIMAEYLCYLYPTAPFIDKNILQGCLNMIKKRSKRSFHNDHFSLPSSKIIEA